MRNPISSSSTSPANNNNNNNIKKTTKTTACCAKVGVKRGPWTPEEDEKLCEYIKKEGSTVGRWRTLPKRAGLSRCGKSCRLRWMNYLRPSVKRGHIQSDEEDLILRLHRLLGNRHVMDPNLFVAFYSQRFFSLHFEWRNDMFTPPALLPLNDATLN